ncbi:hypothetical protein OG900_22160 [Streptomyces sp. NBC_00433]
MTRTRRACAVAAVSAVLAVVSGCGGGTKAGPATSPATTAAGAGAPATASAAAPAPPPVPVPTFTAAAAVTVRTLTSLTFKDGATPGTYDMPVTALTKEAAGTRTRPPLTPAACQDVWDIVYGKAAPAGVSQLINWKADIFPGAATLTAYPHGTAAGVFRVLTADLSLCRTVSGVDAGGSRYTDPIAREAAPKAGDQAVRFQEAATLPDGDVKYTDRVVVRVGDVIAAFDMVDVGRRTPFPAALLTREVQRLAAARR